MSRITSATDYDFAAGAARAKRLGCKRDYFGDYMRQLQREADEAAGKVPVALQALDELGVVLTGHGHKWTPRERRLYERGVASLIPKWRP